MQPELGQSTEICGNTTTVTGKHAPFNDSRTAAVSNPSSQKEMRCSKKQKRPQNDRPNGAAFGDYFGAFGDSAFGQFPWQHEANDALDLSGRDGVVLVVVNGVQSLGGNELENVNNERIHNTHGLGRGPGGRVDLGQHPVHVSGIALLARFPPFLGRLLGDFRQQLLRRLARRTFHSHSCHLRHSTQLGPTPSLFNNAIVLTM
ncbi:uncharacterized protein LOC121276143 isoform X1 [Carcharodon carcharias]|uniref:uncharacterized protein LOC121276143 isoform X1 n=1 Tax=Carcharodon carcharias TaxID=13397 RepID=UPI001B7E276D|nr:uncharacterized protein LOC121276143 isoform X1 [Carcharodon carcharias]